MPVKKPCRAKNPSTCPYHGTAPQVQAFLQTIGQSKADPADVNVKGVKHDVEGFQKAWANQGITQPSKKAVDAWNRAYQRVADNENLYPADVLADRELDVSYGRHRGGPWLILVPDNASTSSLDQYPSDSDDYPRLNAENLHMLDEGYNAVAAVYTRNGGGNRECDCDNGWEGEHENYCTAAINEVMQAHPAYLSDADSVGDHTYAEFFFNINDSPELRNSIRNAELATLVQETRQKIIQVREGAIPPWALADTDPKKEATVRALREDLAQVNLERPSGINSYVMDQTDPAELKAKMENMSAALTKLRREQDPSAVFAVLAEDKNRVFATMSWPRDRDIYKYESALRELRREKTDDIVAEERTRKEVLEKKELLIASYNEGRLPKELGDLSSLLAVLDKGASKSPSYAYKSHKERVKIVNDTLSAIVKGYKQHELVNREKARINAKLEPLTKHYYAHWQD